MPQNAAMRRPSIRTLGIVALALVGAPVAGIAAPNPEGAAAETLEVPVFRGASIFFRPDSTGVDALPGVEDHGRIARAEVRLPDPVGPCRILARLTLSPVPLDERSVHDRWDRAGSIRLVTPGAPDLEVVRFMTSYGGRTRHEVDVTELAPLLRGDRTFRTFVDTWVDSAWTVDVSLRYAPDSTVDAPTWLAPVYFTDSMNRESHAGGVEVPVEIPRGLSRVVLRYLSTGHCTDGRDEDEFISKANVISVDGVVVARFHPWRDDCRRFRDRNPYCARWSDGSWSSDYSRSGWCPGSEVVPTEFDLTDHLTPGKHRIRIAIENIRPRDAEGHQGYWRVSAGLVGWDHPPALWRN